MGTSIDLSKYVTVDELVEATGIPRRSVYRIIDRLGADAVSVAVLGRRLVKKSAIAAIEAEHAPPGSERRHQIAVACGHAGGSAKAANRRKAASKR